MLCTVRHTRYLPVALVFTCTVMMSQNKLKSQDNSGAQAEAMYVEHPIVLDAAHPASDWERARSISFYSNWQGKSPDSARETTVKLLWSSETLYLRFECKYRDLFVFDDSDSNGRRDHLWDRDVAEVFLQPDPSRLHEYKELEISPNGMWIDLDISPTGMADLKSGLERSFFLDKTSRIWAAELALPLKSLTPNFDPSREWKANFFRIEGREEPRTYLAWRPTYTEKPNFHVPEAFGVLRFSGRH
jgi:alpha-galactosidase